MCLGSIAVRNWLSCYISPTFWTRNPASVQRRNGSYHPSEEFAAEGRCSERELSESSTCRTDKESVHQRTRKPTLKAVNKVSTSLE